MNPPQQTDHISAHLLKTTHHTNYPFRLTRPHIGSESDTTVHIFLIAPANYINHISVCVQSRNGPYAGNGTEVLFDDPSADRDPVRKQISMLMEADTMGDIGCCGDMLCLCANIWKLCVYIWV